MDLATTLRRWVKQPLPPHILFFLTLTLLPSLAMSGVPVTVAPMSEVLVEAERSAPAAVEALNRPALAAEINARVEAIAVRVGDRVATGDLLAQLDCRSYRAALASARADLQGLRARQTFAQPAAARPGLARQEQP